MDSSRRVCVELVGVILCFLLVLGCVSKSTPVPQASLGVLAIYAAEKVCKADTDCMLHREDCCGCNQGGKQSAFNRIYLEDVKKRFAQSCSQIACMQVISQDPSCSAESATCIAGVCAPAVKAKP